MPQEIENLWPLSENYEYAAEVGLMLRNAIPGMWQEWQEDTTYLPQESGFRFLRYAEQEEPALLKQIIPDLIRSASSAMQNEWNASLQEHIPWQTKDPLPPPPANVPLLWAPWLARNYNSRAQKLWRWTEEALPDLDLLISGSADPLYLSRIHSGEYLRGLRALSEAGGGRITPETEIVRKSWLTLLAVAEAERLAALHAWKERTWTMVFAVPGSHHAGRSTARGTCLLNHLALSAEELRRQSGVNRVAILDLDAHHGNGTEEIFFYRNDVLTVSVHQAEPFFPGTGGAEMHGSGKGKGYNRNLPLNPEDSWIEKVEASIHIVKEFSPDIILMQFGGDAHWRDEASDLRATSDEFKQAGALLRNLQLPLMIEMGASTDPLAWQSALRALLAD